MQEASEQSRGHAGARLHGLQVSAGGIPGWRHRLPGDPGRVLHLPGAAPSRLGVRASDRAHMSCFLLGWSYAHTLLPAGTACACVQIRGRGAHPLSVHRTRVVGPEHLRSGACVCRDRPARSLRRGRRSMSGRCGGVSQRHELQQRALQT